MSLILFSSIQPYTALWAHTAFELSQIRGGEWVNVDGEWIWIEDHVIDDIGYPIKSQNYLGDF